MFISKKICNGIFFVKQSDVNDFLKSNIGVLQLRDTKKVVVNGDYDVSTYGKSKGLT